MKVLLVGRAKECNIMIDDPQVSRNHLQLIQTDENLAYVVDLKSRGGTYINGHKIESDKPKQLNEGDIIRIGSTLLKWSEYLKQDFEQLTVRKSSPENIEKEEDEKALTEEKISIKKHHEAKNEAVNKPYDKTDVTYAGFGVRLVALIIDSVVLFAINLLIWIIFVSINPAQSDYEAISLAFVLLIVSTFVSFLYYSIGESLKSQATIGKHAMNIKVCLPDGGRISFFRSVFRQVGKVVSAAIFLFGFFMVGFTEKKQALHDYMAGTIVAK